MSIFGSSSSTITSDYFGDEFGLPLPQISTAKNNPLVTTQLEEIGNPVFSKAVIKELKNGFINGIRIVENRGKPGRGEPALAPILDGLFCFETFVISNVK
ncbi:hypothetical protein HRI_004420500 [Hibiscus trionum]|uniref:Uncharacterized protein n=1 Tax=Hibiscus trionum TaxID=183268 RepID=A0A9W7J704_HIBTR|nr:hypothetical protein HRI_004420500 [Hibiscus trionum]